MLTRTLLALTILQVVAGQDACEYTSHRNKSESWLRMILIGNLSHTLLKLIRYSSKMCIYKMTQISFSSLTKAFEMLFKFNPDCQFSRCDKCLCSSGSGHRSRTSIFIKWELLPQNCGFHPSWLFLLWSRVLGQVGFSLALNDFKWF